MNITETAVFGGGCFWCTEAVFKILKGVVSVAPGYAGGMKPNPTYEEVCRGDTGYAEVVKIDYDPAVLSFQDLLTVFFATHDPSTPNRQGNDVGPQYRSAIFFTTSLQKEAAIQFIKELNGSSPAGRPVVTELAPLDTFYAAESYHKDYYARNKSAPYCQVIINPKLKKVQQKFSELLADKEKTKEER